MGCRGPGGAEAWGDTGLGSGLKPFGHEVPVLESTHLKPALGAFSSKQVTPAAQGLVAHPSTSTHVVPCSSEYLRARWHFSNAEIVLGTENSRICDESTLKGGGVH